MITLEDVAFLEGLPKVDGTQVCCEAGLGQMVTAMESMGIALESLRGQVAKLEAKVAKLERENR